MKASFVVILLVGAFALASSAQRPGSSSDSACRLKRAFDYPEIVNTVSGFMLQLNKIFFNGKILQMTDAQFAAEADAIVTAYTTENVNFVFPLANVNSTGRGGVKGMILVSRQNSNWGERAINGGMIVNCIEGEDNKYKVTYGDNVIARTPLSNATNLIGHKTFVVERASDRENFLISFLRFDVIGPVPFAPVFFPHP